MSYLIQTIVNFLFRVQSILTARFTCQAAHLSDFASVAFEWGLAVAFQRNESSHHSKPQYVRTVATYLHLKPYGCDPILPSGKFPLALPGAHNFIIELLKTVHFFKLHQPLTLFFSVFSISFNIISLTVLSATLRICSPHATELAPEAEAWSSTGNCFHHASLHCTLCIVHLY